MPSKFTEVTSRDFSPTLAPGLSDEARKAVNAAFDAMSTWRTETVNNSEKSFERVIDKIAAAARALGWPEQIIDATRAQMEGLTKMQIQTMDYHDGCLGGTDQITELVISDTIEAKVLAQL